MAQDTLTLLYVGVENGEPRVELSKEAKGSGMTVVEFGDTLREFMEDVFCDSEILNEYVRERYGIELPQLLDASVAAEFRDIN